MAAVYKSLSKGSSNGNTRDADAEKPRNRQRVLMLSSRGVTMRYAPERYELQTREQHH
jgi:ribosome biogenesis protein BRX1